MIRILNILFVLMLPVLASAQAKENIMYSNGRIYVVVAVLLTICIGIIVYLIRIERKINKLKKGDY